MKVITGNKKDGWMIETTDVEFRVIASIFKEMMIQAMAPDNSKTEKEHAAAASFACSAYNEMLNARGEINDPEDEKEIDKKSEI